MHDKKQAPMTPTDAPRIQSKVGKTGNNQGLKKRAQSAGDRNANHGKGPATKGTERPPSASTQGGCSPAAAPGGRASEAPACIGVSCASPLGRRHARGRRPVMQPDETEPRLIPIRVSLGNLVLDAQNYRTALDLEEEGEGATDEAEILLPEVQERLLRILLDRHRAHEIKASIIDHGWLPVDQIVVRRHRTASADGYPRYVVVEGNRRIAALKDLLFDFEESKSPAPEQLVEVSESLPVLLIDGGSPDAQDRLANRIMGMRHISGVRSWGGVEAAMLIVNLVDKRHMTMSQAAESLVGVSTIEARRRYRSFKAFRRASEDGVQLPGTFTLLGEAIRTRAIREWLQWSDESARFENRKGLLLVYDKMRSGDSRESISNPQAMRNLRFVIEDGEALAEFECSGSLAASRAILAKKMEIPPTEDDGDTRLRQLAVALLGSLREQSSISAPTLSVLQEIGKSILELSGEPVSE